MLMDLEIIQINTGAANLQLWKNDDGLMVIFWSGL